MSVRPKPKGELATPTETPIDADLHLHALRTTFSSWLADAGVPERKQKALTRHADRDITGRRYTDRSLFDLWVEIAKLPPIRWNDTESQTLQATGTDDSTGRGVVLPVVLSTGTKGVLLAATDRKPNESVKVCHNEKSLKNKGKTAFSSGENDWAMQDLNLRPPACKAGALAN